MWKFFAVVLLAALVAGKPRDTCRRDTGDCSVDKINIDIYLVVDSSASIDAIDYERVRQFLRAIVAAVNVAPGFTKLGLVQFSDTILTKYELPALPAVNPECRMWDDGAFVTTVIDNLVQIAGLTDILEGLKFADVDFRRCLAAFPDRNEIVDGQDKTTNYIILFTDGEQTEPIIPTPNAVIVAYALTVRTYAILWGVAVGSGADQQLISDMSTPGFASQAANFEELLRTVFETITNTIVCDDNNGCTKESCVNGRCIAEIDYALLGTKECCKQAPCTRCFANFQCAVGRCVGNLCVHEACPCTEWCPGNLGLQRDGDCKTRCVISQDCAPGFSCLAGACV